MSLLGIDADPNNYNKENLMRSLEFADFHRFDNISYFDSRDDLVNKFKELDFDLYFFANEDGKYG